MGRLDDMRAPVVGAFAGVGVQRPHAFGQFFVTVVLIAVTAHCAFVSTLHGIPGKPESSWSAHAAKQTQCAQLYRVRSTRDDNMCMPAARGGGGGASCTRPENLGGLFLHDYPQPAKQS